MSMQAGSIVATHLVATGAQRSSTVVVACDDIGVRLEASLEVRAYGRHENHEQIVAGSMHAHLSGNTDEERTHIERGTTLVGRDVVLIQEDHLLHHLYKHLCRHLGHLDTVTSGLQACSILVRTEEAHVSVGTAIGLQTLESLLSVVQTGGRHMHVDILVGADFYLAPLAVVIIATHIVVGWHIAKRQTCPVNVLHHINNNAL